MPLLAHMTPEEIESALTPTPSISRTGKKAHSAMHTDALVRSGVAALTQKKSPKAAKCVTLAEVVDPGQINGANNVPGEDAGRSKEICSSPRGRPELQERLEKLMMNERTEQFRAKMHLVEKRAKQAAPPEPDDLLSPLSTMMSSAPPSPTVKSPQLPSACFRTTDRFANSNKAQTPPVGHYRPKYTAVDSNTYSVIIRRTPPRTPQRSKKERDSPTSSQGKRGRFPEVPTPKDQPAKKEDLTSPLTHTLASLPTSNNLIQQSLEPGQLTSSRENAPVPPSRPPQDDSQTANVFRRYERGRTVSLKRGSPPFVSALKNAANSPPKKGNFQGNWFYYPVNEAAVTNSKMLSGANICIAKQTGRNTRIIFKGFGGKCQGPDVVYEPKQDTYRCRAAYKFDDQVSRKRAAVDAQAMASRKVQACNSAADVGKNSPPAISCDPAIVEKVKFQRSDICLKFDYVAGRDQRPTELQRPRQVLEATMSTADTKSLGSTKSGATIDFTKQTSRPPHRPMVHDLEYDVKTPSKSTPVPDLSRTSGHVTPMNLTIGMNCSYQPKFEATRPRTSQAPSLEKMLSRDEATARHPKKTTLDTFYNTQATVKMNMGGSEVVVPLMGSRTQGNPMIHSHMSRDKRAQLMEVKKSCADKFYDYDISKVRPNESGHNIQFNRSVGRDACACGRIMPTSPRMEIVNPRSPGPIYDPRPVEKHLHSTRF